MLTQVKHLHQKAVCKAWARWSFWRELLHQHGHFSHGVLRSCSLTVGWYDHNTAFAPRANGVHQCRCAMCQQPAIKHWRDRWWQASDQSVAAMSFIQNRAGMTGIMGRCGMDEFDMDLTLLTVMNNSMTSM